MAVEAPVEEGGAAAEMVLVVLMVDAEEEDSQDSKISGRTPILDAPSHRRDC